MSIAGPRHPHLVALGARIRSLREATGLSQEAFAAAAGLDRTYYSGIERGERNVAGLNLIRIALVLKVEVGELFPPVAAFPQEVVVGGGSDDSGVLSAAWSVKGMTVRPGVGATAVTWREGAPTCLRGYCCRSRW